MSYIFFFLRKYHILGKINILAGNGEKPMNTIDANNWASFLKLLSEESCVLMLGPQIPTTKNAAGEWKPISELLARDLSKILDTANVDYDQDNRDNLLYITERYLEIPRRKKLNLQQDIKNLIDKYNPEISPIYETLAKMPFYIIVNTTPSDAIQRALKKEGKYPIEYNFNFRRAQPFTVDFDKISIETPLVISLFGSLQPRQEDSMVLTDDDGVEFIRNIMTGVSKIPTELLREFQYLKAYLFLGFNFDDWNLRLLMKALSLNDENIPISPRLASHNFSSMTKSYYGSRFNFQFTQNSITDLVESLKKEYDQLMQADAVPVLTTAPKKTFLAYHQSDEDFAAKMRQFLKPLESEGLVEVYNDTLPGADITDDINDKLEAAEVVFLLLSASFIASDVLYKKIRTHALAKFATGTAMVVPVIVRSCGWENEIGKIRQVLPANKIPVKNWDDPDSAYDDMIRDFREMLANQ